MHRPNVAVETDEGEEEDAAVHADGERDLLELAEDLYVFEVRPLEGKVEGEGQGEDPGGVAQSQVHQENIAGAPGFLEAGVVDEGCEVSQDPDRKGKTEENQQDVAVPLALELAAEYCGLVQELQEHLWDVRRGGQVSFATWLILKY